jgi:hypothetical protein
MQNAKMAQAFPHLVNKLKWIDYEQKVYVVTKEREKEKKR